MREHPVRRNLVAGKDRTTKRDQRFDLRLWIARQTSGMAGIGNLDSDRARVDVLRRAPAGFAGVPGAPPLRHERDRAAVGVDEIVRRDMARGVAEPAKRLIVVRHAGVMEEQDVDRPVRSLAVVRRRHVLDREVGGNAAVAHAGAGARMCSILSQAALMAASRSLAMRANSAGTPCAISRSGWFSTTRRRYCCLSRL